jgi:poly(A) polymerase
LGAKPKDFDISTDARPERIIDLFPKSGQVGAHFGVVLVRDAGAQVEVATFRSDHDYHDGRRPASVHFESDPREDVLRRDFTINGLMMEADTGKVLDYVGGRADLERRVVRAIGDPDARFREDHLRLVRAIRFAARLGFEIESATFEAVRRHHALILKVSAERVRDELTRILTEGGARYGFELLDASGMLADLLPEVAAMKGVGQPPEFHPEGDVWTHTLLLLAGLGRAAPTLAWGALLHDVGKPPTFRVAERIRFDGHVGEGVKLAHGILNRLRFSRDDMEQVEALIANHMRFKDAHRMKQSTLKRFLRMPDFGEHLELHRLDCLAGNRNLENYELVKRKLEELPVEQLKPAPLVTGADLIAEGYQPGPRFAEMLAAVEDAQLEGRIGSREEAMKMVREMFP